MKKLMALTLGLGLCLGTVTLASPQDTKTTKKQKTPKKSKTKKTTVEKQ